MNIVSLKQICTLATVLRSMDCSGEAKRCQDQTRLVNDRVNANRCNPITKWCETFERNGQPSNSRPANHFAEFGKNNKKYKINKFYIKRIYKLWVSPTTHLPLNPSPSRFGQSAAACACVGCIEKFKLSKSPPR